jgi:hypothetical protein
VGILFELWARNSWWVAWWLCNTPLWRQHKLLAKQQLPQNKNACANGWHDDCAILHYGVTQIVGKATTSTKQNACANGWIKHSWVWCCFKSNLQIRSTQNQSPKWLAHPTYIHTYIHTENTNPNLIYLTLGSILSLNYALNFEMNLCENMKLRCKTPS